MPHFSRDDIDIYYEEHGAGFPILLFAPGGMRSAIPYWEAGAWNPIERLAPYFRVIAMDQRNAGQSIAPVAPEHGWHTYTEDHLALLDHLKITRCHLLGGCIGGPYCMGVMSAAPERVAAAVLQQTIGLSSENRLAFYQMFDSWADEIKASHPHMSDSDWQAFRGNMYDGDFVFNVDRDFVSSCPIPLLLLMGNDLYHPQQTSREIAALAPQAELIEQWKEPDAVEAAVMRVIEFLQRHAD